MEPIDLIDHCNALLTRVEKLWKLALAILAFVLTGTLWGARLEWRVTETAEKLSAVADETRATSLDVSRIKGHMGITKTPAPIPPQQTAAANPPCTDPKLEPETR